MQKQRLAGLSVLFSQWAKKSGGIDRGSLYRIGGRRVIFEYRELRGIVLTQVARLEKKKKGRRHASHTKEV